MKNERRTVKNDEEFPQNHLRKRYGSTSTRFFFKKTCFLPKIAEMHSQGVFLNIFETAPLPYLQGKREVLTARGFLRKISKRTPITKFTPLSCNAVVCSAYEVSKEEVTQTRKASHIDDGASHESSRLITDVMGMSDFYFYFFSSFFFFSI